MLAKYRNISQLVDFDTLSHIVQEAVNMSNSTLSKVSRLLNECTCVL